MVETVQSLKMFDTIVYNSFGINGCLSNINDLIKLLNAAKNDECLTGILKFRSLIHANKVLYNSNELNGKIVGKTGTNRRGFNFLGFNNTFQVISLNFPSRKRLFSFVESRMINKQKKK